jgi:hypothetical protein
MFNSQGDNIVKHFLAVIYKFSCILAYYKNSYILNKKFYNI